MAEFCMDCSIRLFGEDLGDLAWENWEEYTNLDDLSMADMSLEVLCEGCGPIFVDRNGYRVGRVEEENKEE